VVTLTTIESRDQPLTWVVVPKALETLPCGFKLNCCSCWNFLPLNTYNNSFISNLFPSPYYFPSLKRIKKNLFVLPMILLARSVLITKSLDFSLCAFMAYAFPSLNSLYYFSLFPNMENIMYKYDLPKITPHTSKGTTSATTSSIEFWLMVDLNFHFLFNLNYTYCLTLPRGYGCI
jgi:hypothetical protein